MLFWLVNLEAIGYGLQGFSRVSGSRGRGPAKSIVLDGLMGVSSCPKPQVSALGLNFPTLDSRF